jgi:hypothetical protein
VVRGHVKVQVLLSPDCANGALALALVTEVVRQEAPSAEVETVTVSTAEDALRRCCPGSPTVRVDGVDIDPQPSTDYGLG